MYTHLLAQTYRQIPPTPHTYTHLLKGHFVSLRNKLEASEQLWSGIFEQTVLVDQTPHPKTTPDASQDLQDDIFPEKKLVQDILQGMWQLSAGDHNKIEACLNF